MQKVGTLLERVNSSFSPIVVAFSNQIKANIHSYTMLLL